MNIYRLSDLPQQPLLNTALLTHNVPTEDCIILIGTGKTEQIYLFHWGTLCGFYGNITHYTPVDFRVILHKKLEEQSATVTSMNLFYDP